MGHANEDFCLVGYGGVERPINNKHNIFYDASNGARPDWMIQTTAHDCDAGYTKNPSKDFQHLKECLLCTDQSQQAMQ